MQTSVPCRRINVVSIPPPRALCCIAAHALPQHTGGSGRWEASMTVPHPHDGQGTKIAMRERDGSREDLLIALVAPAT